MVFAVFHALSNDKFLAVCMKSKSLLQEREYTETKVVYVVMQRLQASRLVIFLFGRTR